MKNHKPAFTPQPSQGAFHFRCTLPLAALSLAVLAACSTTPPVNDQVSRARSGLDLARSDPQTRDLPGAEMRQATEALAAAEAALAARDDMATVDHLGYLAQQRVGLLVEAGNRRAAETAVAQANTEREQMRLTFEKWKVEYMAGVDMRKHQDGMQERELGAQREQYRAAQEAEQETEDEGNDA